MFNDSAESLTDLAHVFLQPQNSTHRQYEALRAYFVEALPSAQAAHRGGYTPGSFRVLVHQFRQNPHRQFFLPPAKGPKTAPRTENLSIYDISRVLSREAEPLSPVAVSLILQHEGFARLPRRRDEERPPATRPTAAAVANVAALDLSPHKFRTRFGGLFLFLPTLVPAGLDCILQQAGFPGSRMVPAPHAVRSLLGLKLFGTARHSHGMSYVFDEGLALFAGLNVVPQRSFLTEYSCRLAPQTHGKLMRLWFDAMSKMGLPRGASFDLDFHTVPFHGEEALMEKHYVSRRSRRQKGVLAFLAQDADTRVFCYAHAGVRKQKQNDEILAFVDYWKQRTGRLPEELIFDSKLTTYAKLNRLNRMGVRFMTLRRRSPKMMADIAAEPISAWRRIEIEGVSRTYRTPRILDRRITLADYEGPIRQLTIADLGHEDPTLLLTNQLTRSARELIRRYAQRMVIENSIADGIDFFHMDALSSAVALKVDCDLQLTLMASSLYRLLGQRIGNGYETAKSRHLFRDLVDATAQVTITDKEIEVRFQKRAHNPLLLAAGFDKTNLPIPWLDGKRLRLVFG